MTAPTEDYVSAPRPPESGETTWLQAVAAPHGGLAARKRILGVLPGEGIGREVVSAALHVLDAVEARAPLGLQRVEGPAIGLEAKGSREGEITPENAGFCRDIFNQGGVLFCGPGGGRFVYDIRRHFDLFCKIAPIKPSPRLVNTTRFKPEILRTIDFLVVRDNSGGVYQGRAVMHLHGTEGEMAEQSFSYTRGQVQRIVEAGARLARLRSGRMHVIIKDGGVPVISTLWRKVAMEVAAAHDIQCTILNADYAAYLLIQQPAQFDVLVTPNMIGDILADLGAVFLGSRGLSYSGNFSADGRAVYQTGHGAAYDLARSGRANPAGQILTLAMMLRESFDAPTQAALVELALDEVWKAGWRTDDLIEPGCRRVGLEEMAELVAQAVRTVDAGDAV